MDRDYTKIKLQGTEPIKDLIGTSLDGKTVYSELKLSEILLQDVDLYKKIIEEKNEQINEKDFKIGMLEKEMKE